MDLSNLLIVRRLANREGEARKVTAIEAVPAMGLDGLASSAYGPEAALTILIPAGARGLHVITPIMVAILVLLAMLCLSYWQTIEAYPSNGGSYTVAKENLAADAGLLAAAALMIDYVLNVAVAISAGIAALTSAIPQLHPYTLELCLAVLALITIVVNLRGTLEAGPCFLGADLPLYRQLWRTAALRVRQSNHVQRTPDPDHGSAAAVSHHGRRDMVVVAACLCQRLHGDDRRRGGQ